MRFFSGIRDKKDPKKSASAMWKAGLNKKDGPAETKDEKYKKMLDKKMAQILNEIAMGKKNKFKLPGTKEDDKPKEVSKNYLAMLETLARKKAEQDMKKQNKKQKAYDMQQKAIKKAHINKLAQEQNQKDMLVKQTLYQQQLLEEQRLLEEQQLLEQQQRDLAAKKDGGWW